MKFRFWREDDEWREQSDDTGSWGNADNINQIIIGYLAMRIQGKHWIARDFLEVEDVRKHGKTWEEVLKGGDG